MPLSLSVLALLQGLQGTLPLAPMALDHLSTWKPAESKLTDRASSQKVCMHPLHSPGGWRLSQKAHLQFTTVFPWQCPQRIRPWLFMEQLRKALLEGEGQRRANNSLSAITVR